MIIRGIMVALLMATAAVGQVPDPEPGSRIAPLRAKIPVGSDLSKFDQGRLVMAQFAACAVNRGAKKVGLALALPGDVASNTALYKLATSLDCLASGQMRFEAAVLRDALFVELYRRRESGTETIKLPAYNFSPGEPQVDLAPVRKWLIYFADCVVSRDRAASSAFVKAPATSPAEKSAFEALFPSLSPCVTEGDKMELNYVVIKGSLAEALYRGPLLPVAAEPK